MYEILQSAGVPSPADARGHLRQLFSQVSHRISGPGDALALAGDNPRLPAAVWAECGQERPLSFRQNSRQKFGLPRSEASGRPGGWERLRELA